MTAVAFAATLKKGPIVTDVNEKKVTLSLQMPEVWAAAGVALDMSAAALGGFSVVTRYQFGPSAAVGDSAYKFDLFGTESDDDDGITASTCTIAGHWGCAGTAAAYPAIPDSTDLKAITDLKLTIWGY
jgi:hypothetical protein